MMATDELAERRAETGKAYETIAELMADAVERSDVTAVSVDFVNNKYITASIIDKLTVGVLQHLLKIGSVTVLHYDDRDNSVAEIQLLDYLKLHRKEIYERLKLLA